MSEEAGLPGRPERECVRNRARGEASRTLAGGALALRKPFALRGELRLEVSDLGRFAGLLSPVDLLFEFLHRLAQPDHQWRRRQRRLAPAIFRRGLQSLGDSVEPTIELGGDFTRSPTSRRPTRLN